MLFETKVDIDKKAVYRYLGFKEGTQVSARIVDEVERAVDEAKELVNPAVFYQEFPCGLDKENKRVMLPNGQYFTGSYPFTHLAGSRFLVVAVSTLGFGFEKIRNAAGMQGSMTALVYDAVGNAALMELNHRFWLFLAEDCRKKGLGLSRQVSPGDNDWPLEEQEVVFGLLQEVVVGVELSDSFIMAPFKSHSLVYGIKDSPDISQEGHDCSECNLHDCMFRREAVAKSPDNPDKKYEVVIIKGKKEKKVEAPEGENLFDLLFANGLSPSNSCGGNHTCGECQVEVQTEKEIAISEEEAKLLRAKGAKSGSRLACYIRVDRNMKVVVPEKEVAAQVFVEGTMPDIKLQPRVERREIKLSRFEEDEDRDNLTRFFKGNKELAEGKVSYQVLQKLPGLLQEEADKLDVVCCEKEIIDVNRTGGEKGIHGLAVDMGTTTLAIYLLDLTTGAVIDVASSLNPQKDLGADVISRIQHTVLKESGLKELQTLVINELNRVIQGLCRQNGLRREEIYEIIFVGNTTMLHLLLGVSCAGLASSPFIPAFLSGIRLKARDLGLKINAEAYVQTLPGASAYVGADTMAALLAVGMHKAAGINLLVDIGTNGEIVLGGKKDLYCCSTAAGPAFEGGKITFGVGGIKGAIDHVDFNRKEPYTTIGGTAPVGICGSGLLDLVAELLKYGVIDKTGRMQKAEAAVVQVSEGLSGRLVSSEEKPAFVLDENSGILLTQGDVREFQLAKAAIYAGIEVLADKMGVGYNEIDKVYLAGGFGNYLDLESAFTVKLLPHGLRNKVVPVGNAAGTGAKMALLSAPFLQEADGVGLRMKHVELSTSEVFQERFIKAINF